MTSVQTLHRYDEPRAIDEPAVRFGLSGFALFAAAGVVVSAVVLVCLAASVLRWQP